MTIDELIEHLKKTCDEKCMYIQMPTYFLSKIMERLAESMAKDDKIKELLMKIEEYEKPENVNTDDENYAHLPITKCPKCKRPIRMYYDPCNSFLTKACPYCGKMVTWE